MRKFALAALPLCFVLALPASAAIVDFEDLGVAPGTQLNPPNDVAQNSGGYTFTPGPIDNGPNDLHFHNENGFGDNGGTHMGTHDDVVMTKVGGGQFSLNSFDFAGFVSEATVEVTGNLFGGGTISTTFFADGNTTTYETVTLGAGWTNLVSVSWLKPVDGFNGFFLDNIVIDAIPEPATWAMMIAGFGLAGGVARTRRARSVLA